MRLRIVVSLIACLCFSQHPRGAAPDDLCTPLTGAQKSKNKQHVDDAARYATYAILSNNAYTRAHVYIPLPANWREVPELRRERSGEPQQPGLELAVVEKRDGEQIAEVFVSFRGTDVPLDCIQNSIPFFRIQVDPADQMFNAVRKRYAGSGARMVATGHSLGGGLAFHMSFRYKNVDAVVFNSSPVTKAGLTVEPGNHRVSIWESSEGLEPLRAAVADVRSRWEDVFGIKVRFLHGNPLAQHSMQALAFSLVRLAAEARNPTGRDSSPSIARNSANTKPHHGTHGKKETENG
jgi:hypothetical protein